jgi:hypothetical protein
MPSPFLRSVAPALALLALLAPPGAADQVVHLQGRLLDKANGDGVPGASVLIAGSSTGAVSDSAGRFRIDGMVPVRPVPAGHTRPPRFADGALWMEASAPAAARIELFTAGGESLSASDHPLRPGPNRLDVFADAPRGFAGFLRIQSGGQAWILRALRVPGPAALGWAGRADPVPSAPAKADGGGNRQVTHLEITAAGLAPRTVAFSDDAQDLGDIVLDYPERRLGVGAPPVYGAVVLFDGARGRAEAAARLQADWMDWPRFTPSDPEFRIVRDPAYPNDTNRVALQACCNTLWGYDDIQAKVGLYRDCQIHVEWIGMGEYDDPYDAAAPDPNASDPAGEGQKGYINSGVYAASRYEVQIFSWDTAAAKIPGIHDMGAIVDDYAPTANRNRPNGEWQAYDITYRGARFEGATMVSAPYMSVWWNGTLVHDNRKLTGAAAGLANHSGEEHGDTAVYGLKLQSEGRDVRFRNVWIKKLALDAPQTNLGF